MQKTVGIIGALALVAIVFGGGYTFGKGQGSLTPGSAEFEKAAKAGQLATIVQIINQATANPCQAINLYNRSDDQNPQEINLINVQCEGLGLPDINDAKETTE